MTDKPTVLVTGANGFVGRHLCNALIRGGYGVRPAVRSGSKDTQTIIVGDINDQTNWSTALLNTDVIIHLAARVHILNETSKNPLESFRAVNVAGTVQLAQRAIEAGVKRLIFVSSIGVNGENTQANQPFTEQDISQPHSPYAQSKLEAEQALQMISKKSPLEIVIVRPPMVYGIDAPGNFERLLHLVKKGLFLPFGSISNRRSFVSVENLSDFLIRCIEHESAKNELFLISDGEAISTTELVKRIASVLQVKPILVSVPEAAISILAKLTGRQKLINQLWKSLEIDITKAQNRLNWQPPQTMQTALQQIAQREELIE